MKDVCDHIRAKLTELKFPQEDRLDDRFFYIAPKRFRVERVSEIGVNMLTFEQGHEYLLSGLYITQRIPGLGRVFFLPFAVRTDDVDRFIEVKGYGNDGGEMTLDVHGDGDLRNGMFYKNARKEFTILEKARKAGLHVPPALLLGKIPRDEWLRSGLRNLAYLLHDEGLDERLGEKPIDEIQAELEPRLHGKLPWTKEMGWFDAFKQPYNAGLVIRAPLSPFRLGDPMDKYNTRESVKVARQCGSTFMQLLKLGYLHLCPGTGNWTTAGELTDMSDCYDLRKDTNLERVIAEKEARFGRSFWEFLVGDLHTANLTSHFIEGMLGQQVSLTEAAQELQQRTNAVLRRYGRATV